jgi:hypothetical protein
MPPSLFFEFVILSEAKNLLSPAPSVLQAKAETAKFFYQTSASPAVFISKK